MIRFLVRRIAFLLLTALLIIFFVQLGMLMARNSSTAAPIFDLGSQAARAWHDTQSYVHQLLTGNLGIVPQGSGQVPVVQVLRLSYLNSMGLLLAALTGAALMGVTVGALLALTRLSRITTPILTLTILGVSTPSFFAALLLQQGEILYLANTGRRLVSVSGFGWDLDHMLLPLLVLMARPLAYLTRAVYLSLRRVLSEDFVRTARAKGLSQTRTVIIHVLRNTAIPVLTALGVSLRFSLGSLPVIELFFAWPGLGDALLRAVNNQQTTLAVSLALALGMTILVANLLLDGIYRVIDPRLRGEHEAAA
jgi:ABC-type dipeptide/oligopeptide/nickel transport system permease component